MYNQPKLTASSLEETEANAPKWHHTTREQFLPDSSNWTVL
jgi:hypothetical protein